MILVFEANSALSCENGFFPRALAHCASAARPTSTNTQNHQSTKVERSKSFSVKCDKGYSTYYQIEIVKKAPPITSSTTLEHQEHNKPVIENNNYQKLGGFHEVGLPLGPTYKR